ncbi:MAG: tRNA acetyltransferase [Archaeoglobi archaeon]|nr:tRNA acetyltransferase [Archaeoglobi archaeon]
MMKYVITTPRGVERIASSLIKERFPEVSLKVSPGGYEGLILMESEKEISVEILEEIPEIEKVLKIKEETEELKPERIAEICGKVAGEIPPGSSFAVRVKRRGKHDFSSKDIENLAGAEILKRREDLRVNLSAPDFIVKVEIIDQWAGIGIMRGEEIYKKKIGKRDSRELTNRISLVQLIYEAKDPRGVERVASAIGRSAQAFEVRRLIVVFDHPVSSEILQTFLRGVEDGISSRHEIQERSYGRRVQKVPVLVYELYQLLRDIRRDENLIIITDPRGRRIEDVREELKRRIEDSREIFIFNGSNRGIPSGCFRFADFVLDLAPHITYSTDQAITASVISLLNL